MFRAGAVSGFLLALVATSALAQSAAQAPANDVPLFAERGPMQAAHDHLYAILWHQTSAEFEGAARMAYAMARISLDRALADPTHTAAEEQKGDFSKLPPAIITDVDETILDNGPFQGTLMKDQPDRPAQTWAAWVERAEAKAIPGAAEFIRYAQEKGVTIFYITNRNSEKESATRKNLEAIGAKLPANFDTVFLDRERPEWRSDKSLRRAAAATTHRIVLVMGDDFGDFTSSYNKPAAERRQVATQEAARWGRDWIMIPNPIYGSWDNALNNFNFRLPMEERRRMKWDAVRTAPKN